MLLTLGLAYLAGVLSTLSPCVLPLLPVILGTAASAHRLGPLVLALGLVSAFVLAGLFVATIGFSIGLDADVFQRVAATLLVVVGTVLILPPLEARLAPVTAPIVRWAGERTSGISGLAGQFWIGALLGLAWSPCVGPTLGAASLLASQEKDLPQVAATMLLFGVGAASQLLAVGLLSRAAMMRLRDHLLAAGRGLKAALGAAFILVGAAIVSGLDKTLETALVESSPAWLTTLTTRF